MRRMRKFQIFYAGNVDSIEFYMLSHEIGNLQKVGGLKSGGGVC